MVTPTQLRSWRPDRLAEISDQITAHRRALIHQSDELAAGRVPTSWTFASAMAAQAAHQRLADGLATQVAEAANVIAALDAAAAAIRSAKEDLDGAYYAASRHDLRIDGATGAVRMTRSYDNTSDAAYAATQQNYVSRQVDDALAAAAAADEALAAALRTATTTDTNTVGSLDQQREVLEFTEMSTSEQVDYLLAHPEAYALLDDDASPQVKEIVGERVAAELDAVARDATALNDVATVERCTALMTAFGDDQVVMASMYERLEPEGLLATFSNVQSMMYIGSNVDELGGLARELRAGLQVASQDPGFDGETYGRELARYATYDVTDDERAALFDTYGSDGQGHAAVLDFLMRDGDYGESLVRGVAWQMDEFERSNPFGASTWAHHDSLASPLTGLDGVDFSYQPDPMAAVMGQLGKHPELGLEFFTESGAGEARSDFYFAERDWSRDGFSGISEAALAIGTDPENLAGSPEATARFVSEYFDRLPDNPEFNAESADGAAEPVAKLLKFYTPAMEVAIDSGSTDLAVGERLGHIGVESYLPDIDPYPLMDKADLNGLLKVALSTDEGVARVAEGVAGFQRAQLDAYAAANPGGVPGDPGGLERIMTSTATLEGHLQYMTGEIAIEGAESRAQRVETFTNLVSEAVGMFPVPYADEAGEILGDVGKNAWEFAWNKLSEMPTETIDAAYSSNVDAVIQAQEEGAERAANRLVVNAYQALVQAGILEISPEIADAWAPDGVIPRLQDIAPELVGTAAGDMGGAMDHVINEDYLRGVYERQFETYFGKK